MSFINGRNWDNVWDNATYSSNESQDGKDDSPVLVELPATESVTIAPPTLSDIANDTTAPETLEEPTMSISLPTESVPECAPAGVEEDSPEILPSLQSLGLFSSNPDKAWAEKFFLLYTPIWMLSMLYMMLSGAVLTWSNTAMFNHGLCTALPTILVPLLYAPRYSERPWYDSYWVKANLYLAIFGFFGNYFGTEYFFDMLGMTYRFDLVTTTLDSALLGGGKQTVPVIMYFYTHVYFMTYHVTANIALRQIRRLCHGRLLDNGMWSIFPIAVFVIGYIWAWLETKAMANPLMATQFYYNKMDVMLRFGSAIYAIYFVVSFPIWYFIDENKDEPRWTLLQTASAALSASMLTFYGLDFAAHLVSSL